MTIDKEFEAWFSNWLIDAPSLVGQHALANEVWQAARAIDAKRIAELEKDNENLITALASIRDIFEFDDAMVNSGALSYPEDVAGFVKAKIAELKDDLQSNKNMFLAACESLGVIAKHLNLEPEQGGHAPILCAIAELEAQNKAMREVLEKAGKFIGELNFSLDRDLILREIEQALALDKKG